MVHYDFIECGLSDFDCIIQTCSENKIGLSIEPLKFYLDRLPNKKNVQKVNVSLGDKDGVISIYYILPENIEKYGICSWIRGCNSVNKPHPSVINYLKAANLPESLIENRKVEVLTYASLVKKYKIESVKYFKCDTEGNDVPILKSIIEACSTGLSKFPDKIFYESNCLSSNDDLIEIEHLLFDNGYLIIQKTDCDTEVEYKPLYKPLILTPTNLKSNNDNIVIKTNIDNPISLKKKWINMKCPITDLSFKSVIIADKHQPPKVTDSKYYLNLTYSKDEILQKLIYYRCTNDHVKGAQIAYSVLSQHTDFTHPELIKFLHEAYIPMFYYNKTDADEIANLVVYLYGGYKQYFTNDFFNNLRENLYHSNIDLLKHTSYTKNKWFSLLLL